jgi:predicted neuraminidase
MTSRVPILLFAMAFGSAAQITEFVAGEMPTPSCHASTVVELRDGRLMAAWFGGAGEGKPDVAIWGAVRDNGKWQAPAVLVREPEIASYNPVLFHSADGVLWLYYKFGPSPSEWTAGRLASRDEGRSWSAPEHLPAGLYGPIRAKPLVLEDGVIVSGSSVESYGSWACWIERSIDHGRTWSRHGPVTVPRPASAPPVPRGDETGIIQPVVVPMGGRHLRFYARATSDIGRLCVADSLDGGVTWTGARPTSLPNPNAGIDVVRLKDGRLVIVYNHTTKGRTPLNLAVSRDGEHWNMFHALETAPGEYSYPAMIQGRDGALHITYTWRREKIKYVRWPLAAIPGR